MAQVTDQLHSDDRAVFRVTLDVVLDAGGEDHDYLGQRANSALYATLHGELTKGAMSDYDVIEHSFNTTLVSAEAAALDEEQVANWIADAIEGGTMQLEDLPKLMARYALADPGDMRMELAERMGLLERPAEVTDVPGSSS